MRVAHELLAAYDNSVYFVELAALVEPALLPQVVAQRVGVQEVAGQQLLDTLVTAFRSRPCLLVLDNCEHVLNASATRP